MPPQPPPQSGGSLSDIITTAQNLVQAVNNVATTYLNVQGKQNSGTISAATLVKPSAGRVCKVSITTAGAAVGKIYDTNQVTATTPEVYTIPNSSGVVDVNIPVQFGIVVVPGAGQVVMVSYS